MVKKPLNTQKRLIKISKNCLLIFTLIILFPLSDMIYFSYKFGQKSERKKYESTNIRTNKTILSSNKNRKSERDNILNRVEL